MEVLVTLEDFWNLSRIIVVVAFTFRSIAGTRKVSESEQHLMAACVKRTNERNANPGHCKAWRCSLLKLSENPVTSSLPLHCLHFEITRSEQSVAMNTLAQSSRVRRTMRVYSCAILWLACTAISWSSENKANCMQRFATSEIRLRHRNRSKACWDHWAYKLYLML